MKFVRGLGKFLGGILFTTFLVLAILLMDVVSFTSYENVKLVGGDLLANQIFSSVGDDELEDLHNFLLFQCSQTSKVSIPIGRETAILDCNDVRSSDKSQIPNLVATSLLNNLYYKDFECDFLDCVKSGNLEDLAVVGSNEGNQLYKSLQSYMWIGAGIGLIMLLASIETWAGRLKSVGLSLVFTGSPFLFMGYVQTLAIGLIAPELSDVATPIIDDLTGPVKSRMIIILAAGIILLAGGYALEFYLSRKAKGAKK